MAYKTLRNKVLRSANRLIACTYHGQTWSAPGGYFAVNFDIYKDMTIRSYHYDARPSGTPDLGKILDGIKISYKETKESGRDDIVHLTDGKTTLKVNAEYYDFLRTLYPNTVMRMAGCYDPIRFEDNNNLVAVLMPLKG